MDQYEQYIHISRYSRWRDEDKRRETWEETVGRYMNYWAGKDLPKGVAAEWPRIRDAIFNLEVMPSMRSLMTAGPALDRDNVAGYNCAFLAMDKPFKFSEVMYILMCGTGVGFSCETRYTNKLPEVPEDFYQTETTLVVPDSKIGWAKSFKELIGMLYTGQVPKWDLSKIRPAGAKLKTFGGRASGPGPLDELFKFCVSTFNNARGRKLKSIEVHDLVCKIADIVVVGGVRRSALISLSDLGDREMALAKSGQWWVDHPYRSLANNSAVYDGKPSMEVFLEEMTSLYESHSGERGIFNREASKIAAGKSGRRNVDYEFGTNPCSEIILRDRQFCNLTEVIVRSTDTLVELKEKVEIATIIGTLQSTLTDFRFLSSEWKKNCDEERLLGVSLTGICDHPLLSNPDNGMLPKILAELREVSVATNKVWAKKLGIPQSTAITCVKPSGTVSQLCNTASGIHPRFAKYYLRAVRNDKKDPLAQLLIDQGVPYADAPENPNNMYVFSFPVKSPDECKVKDELNAITQLKLWKIYAENWCEHKPSMTTYYKDDEFIDVMKWTYENFNVISGISYLPHSDHVYKHAPYTEITEEEYIKAKETMPLIDFSKLVDYENVDMTTSSKELACTGGSCEI